MHNPQLPQPPSPQPSIGTVMLRLRLIGQMEAWTLTSESMLPTGRKTRALLAIIALFAPRPVLRGRMAEMLWSRRPEEQARASLRQEIHRLHDALDPLGSQVLAITRDHLALRPGAVWVDVEELLRATPARPAALGLYDGELLEGLDGIDPAFDGWLNGERQRLGDRARTVAELMLREQTEPEQMIAVAQQLLRIDRSHEGAWRALMRAHLAHGERGMAIQAYERCRLVLADQLDAQPSAETQRLLADVRNAMPPKLGAEPSYALLGVGRAAPPPRPAARNGARASQHGPEESDQPQPTMPSADDAAESAGRRSGFREVQQPLLAGAAPSRSAAPRGGPRLGVMPLHLIATGPTEAHLSTGLADEITSGLARYRWLWLATSGSLARLAAQGRDEAALRDAFGLDFLVDGAVQRSGDRVRVSLRLLDLRDGHHEVWSRRFEGSAQDLLSLQDEAAAAAAAQIEPEILQVEGQRAAERAADRHGREPSAYDLLLHALSLIPRLDKSRFLHAGGLLRAALTQQPDCAATYAWCAYWHLFLVLQGWAENLPEAIEQAALHAERAIALDPQDARSLTIAGHVRAALQRRPREGIALHDRALGLNPNLAMAWSLSGMAFAFLGELDEAERRIAIGKALSPMDRQAFLFDTAPVMIALLRRDHQAAVTLGRDASSLNAAFSGALQPYLAALGHLGMAADAAAIRGRLLSLQPEFRAEHYLASSPLQRAADREHVGRGMILAGIEA